jgi:CheY-like chemotaxis protein
MKVVVVEDDYLQAGMIRDALTSQYSDIELIDLANEMAFINALPELERDAPDLIILDIMIPWHDPLTRVVAPPQQVDREPLRGGIRLLREIRNRSQLASVPVIVHSALAWHDVENDLAVRPDHVVFVHKRQEPSDLMIVLRSLLAALERLPPERGLRTRDRIWNAVKAAPSFAGFGVDLKALIVPSQTRRRD